jgi:hypothetical protein
MQTITNHAQSRQATFATVTISKSFPHGYWQISAMKGGSRVSRTYIGFTRQEAVAAFRVEVKP